MRLAALYSGGKDSTFSIFRAKEMGHSVACLITMHPLADDSQLFHYPNSWITEYLADSMKIPLIGFEVNGKTKEDEVNALEGAIDQAFSMHKIDGVLHGGISSKFQRDAFEKICKKRNLAVIAPLWNSQPSKYMNELLENKFQVVIVGVSAMGLEKEWLGKMLDTPSLAKLEALSKKYGFNLTFEGGEAETLVIDCPLFRKKLDIRKANTRWDGQRGTFEILEVALVPK